MTSSVTAFARGASRRTEAGRVTCSSRRAPDACLTGRVRQTGSTLRSGGRLPPAPGDLGRPGRLARGHRPRPSPRRLRTVPTSQEVPQHRAAGPLLAVSALSPRPVSFARGRAWLPVRETRPPPGRSGLSAPVAAGWCEPTAEANPAWIAVPGAGGLSCSGTPTHSAHGWCPASRGERQALDYGHLLAPCTSAAHRHCLARPLVRFGAAGSARASPVHVDGRSDPPPTGPTSRKDAAAGGTRPTAPAHVVVQNSAVM
ncbi:hypothetical protein UA74_08345 [Actinoalloteichus fjordicus]|uniref:Uncharacterized protein n=1 Tax=Actinoalloteichus fjordicus TaxID=1612552 RepID=A0AAC9LC63_9PSEU|nr:hypothetical protein UA74_08345 [Actinoalloteichus fjordicus]